MNNKSSFIVELLQISSEYREKVAIVDDCGYRKTTYGELILFAQRVTAYLKQSHVQQGAFIGIMLPDCMEYIAAEIGIWMAGCVAVPLSKDFPESRLDYIFKHCSIKLAIDINLLSIISQYEPNKGEVPNVMDEAILFYTSGSTGSPKGVLHTFMTLDGIEPFYEVFDCKIDDIVLGTAAPLFFGASITIYYALISGGIAHIYGDKIRQDILWLERYVEDNKISINQISPSTIKYFHNRSSYLKIVYAAGERLTTQYSKEGYSLFNIYASTESLVILLCSKIDTKPMNEVPLGLCAGKVTYSVQNEYGKKVPQGQKGELCFKGHFCKGYYKEPELTKELYRDGWLHTGDIVYVGSNGQIYYVNRKDWMIKINGHRIEPGEIENVAVRFEGIDTVVVVAKEIGEEKHLVLYYTSGTEIEEDQLKEHLSRFLANYMVPNFYVRLDEMPRNANGKIDRNRLPAPSLNIKNHIFEEQITNIERSLLDEIRQELQLQDLGLDDDLLSLGFTSLSSMFVQTRLEQKGINFSSGGIEAYKVFLTYRTIRKVAKYLENDYN